MKFFSKDKVTALEAKKAAQWIAFGPVIFQVARVLRNSGILKLIKDSDSGGLTNEEIAQKLSISNYGVRVLLESGLGLGLVLVNDKKYTLGKIGYFILQDSLTRTNMDFVHDVNYKALFYLDESIEKGKAVGLKEFGDWPTIYDGLLKLPPQVQKSWFNFDHYFSDDAFPLVLSIVYNGSIKNVLDIGGNTGKWAIASVNYSPEVHVTVLDLPGLSTMAKQSIAALGLDEKISFVTGNVLESETKIPRGFDAIWMSQFLDCFSEEQIVSVLKKCYDAMDEDGYLFILEPFWDRQKFETASFCLQQISLYFTVMANGNSQMYSAQVFFKCVEDAGFEIIEQTNHIGLSQTLIKCKKIKSI